MKLTAPLALVIATLISLPGLRAEETDNLRRFSLRDGRSFQATIVAKAGSTVTLKLLNGREEVTPLGMLSEPDRMYVAKWTPLKDALMRNADFAKATVQQLLELRGYQTFEFDIQGNHIFVEGELNGKPQRFLIDTGADTSLLDLKAAEEAGLEIGPLTEKVSGVAGEAPAAVVRVPTLKMGDAVMTNRRILAADMFKDHEGPRTYGAIFGADFLRELNAVISYREGRMFLKTDAAAPAEAANTPKSAATGPVAETKQEFRRWTSTDGRTTFAALDAKTETEVVFRLQNGQKAKLPVEKLSTEDQAFIKQWNQLRDKLAQDPEFNRLSVRELLELRGYQSLEYRLNGNHIILDGEANGKKSRFLIDTGAHGGVFHIDFAKEIGLDVGPMDQWIYGIGGKAPAAIVKVKTLKLGDAVIENREMLGADLLRQMKAFGSSHDAIFGADFMRELDAVISYKEARMFLRPGMGDQAAEKEKPAEPAAAPAPPAPAGEPKPTDPFP